MGIFTKYGLLRIPEDSSVAPNQKLTAAHCHKNDNGQPEYYDNEWRAKEVVNARNVSERMSKSGKKWVVIEIQVVKSSYKVYDPNNPNCHFYTAKPKYKGNLTNEVIRAKEKAERLERERIEKLKKLNGVK
ncbi:hypothetical protein GR173_004684 [Salmonella enterica subsp. enterica]|nr:hypothetical protein [Salmonella enterica subsp. enterica]ECB1328205.1 hypothetical protein [Salmonella enterica subsp. enterica serovar Nigeria]EDU0171497.1 hypothetical protein [Salmonella enterica subsp. enterica serovar Belfast]EEF0877429.1 hypothetical protein [Salmonella enterica subsp. enterica serovar Tafo]EDW4633110.1 hypothetical protein [Salmonella enterica subsp. enterica]